MSSMKAIGIGLVGLVVIGLVFLGLNTLAINNVIPLNPVSAVGLPVVTFADVGSIISGAQNTTNAANNMAQGASQTWRQVQAQLNSLATQSEIVGDHVQTIVGDRPLIGVANPSPNPTITSATPSTTPNSNTNVTTAEPVISPTEEPFYTKTLEYGKYLYCQEVVKEYEARNPALKPTTRP